MQKMTVMDTDDAVAGVSALREVLFSEVQRIERILQSAEYSTAIPGASRATSPEETAEACLQVRTSLLSGLASVEEVLGWVHMLAPKDPEGNELECVRKLPYVNVLPTN